MLSFLFLFPYLSFVAAENGLNAWLRYYPLANTSSVPQLIPTAILSLNSNTSSPVNTASLELQKGIQGILGHKVSIHHDTQSSTTLTVGTISSYNALFGKVNSSSVPQNLEEDGFYLSISNSTVQILGQNERGALYGAFEYLSLLARGNYSQISYTSNPNAPIRWVNEWDNLDGTIERGYGGPSIFFSNGLVAQDLTRVTQYARLLASVGINGLVVNNVNAKATLLSKENIDGLGRLADAIRPYGVQLGISLNFASPTADGTALAKLSTFDPLEASVITWWNDMTRLLYQRIPDLAGYLIKANSEGQPGPLTYNRTLADGANLFARAVAPYKGVVMFRAFVYNQHLNESEWKADRANAAVEFFKDLDGKFEGNVVVQIKYGPIDFQVREPVSPLFANLKKTNTAIELQVSQEYLGQQAHLVYLAPMWKEILDFDLRVDGEVSIVKDIVGGRRFKRKVSGSAAVVNIGTNETWLGSHLAMSNLYAYGRLAWHPSLSSEAILQDWIKLTFSDDPAILSVITKISMASWPAYESYSGNLGIQTLTDILYTHFGPNPTNMDNNGWGQWTRADKSSIGMDRTVSNGTGFAGQYPTELAAKFETIATTPEELILWFHHLPYTYRLKSGKSIIQHFYDSHYSGAETAQTFVTQWETLKGKIDESRYNDVLYRLVYQAGHSIVWRDAINGFYHNLSGIADEKGRVGSHPWRIEAESMDLEGYQTVSVEHPEMASSGMAVVTVSDSTTGDATTTIDYPSGTYDIAIGYFDLMGGRSKYEIVVGGKSVGKWVSNNEDTLGNDHSKYLDGHSATRTTFRGVKIERGDELRIIGTPDGIERASLDYVAFLKNGVID
ncbi:alpha-glucuronidase A [Tricladium varicosporioides]|nr:alpha-glucuronidase A [Hymenoscyphus varicosporioides]